MCVRMSVSVCACQRVYFSLGPHPGQLGPAIMSNTLYLIEAVDSLLYPLLVSRSFRYQKEPFQKVNNVEDITVSFI